jgi:hypothetical protein
MKIDTDALLAKLNIVDVINNTGLKLKKEGGNYVMCCPFHAEKSPSFKVNEAKQFYYCFGCGKTGNAIGFVMDFQKVEFREACEMLGANVSATPSEQVKQNMNRVISTLPSYDKRDHDLCVELLQNHNVTTINGVVIFDVGLHFYAPVIDLQGLIVNLYDIVTSDFIAGGVSHLAYTPMIRDSLIDTYLIVTEYDDAIKIFNKHKNVNIIVSHSAYNTKLLAECDMPISRIPVLTQDDTLAHSLMDKGVWSEYRKLTGKLSKRMSGEDFYD